MKIAMALNILIIIKFAISILALKMSFNVPCSGVDDIQSVDTIPMETTRILAACHALTYVDDVLVGDPMEKALLNSVDWTFTKGMQYFKC